LKAGLVLSYQQASSAIISRKIKFYRHLRLKKNLIASKPQTHTKQAFCNLKSEIYNLKSDDYG
jgi:hypothetical protein